MPRPPPQPRLPGPRFRHFRLRRVQRPRQRLPGLPLQCNARPRWGCPSRARRSRFSRPRRMPQPGQRRQRRVRPRLHQPGTYHLAHSMGHAPERLSPALVSRFPVGRRRAARFCRVLPDRTRRSRSVPVSNRYSSRAARASREVILCARPSPANQPRGRWCRRARIWSRVFLSFRPSQLLASPPRPGPACPRRGARCTRGQGPDSRVRVVRVQVGQATHRVPAVRRCVGEGHTPPRR